MYSPTQQLMKYNSQTIVRDQSIRMILPYSLTRKDFKKLPKPYETNCRNYGNV